MKRIILTIVLLLSASSWAITFDEAADIVLNEVLTSNDEGIKVSGLEQVLASGEIVEAWHDTVIVPFDGYYFLVDPAPLANWEHPCTWVFVSEEGEIEELSMTTPPRDNVLLRLVDVINPLPDSDVTYEEIRNQIKRKQKEIFGSDRYDINTDDLKGNRYALLISGGASSGSNHIRYWGDIAFIYCALKYYYGYGDSEITICMSDGDNPAVDRSNGTNSPLDLDGDNADDYSLDATLATVTAQLQYLADNVTADDTVFIFMTDHGGSDGGYNTYLNLWNLEELSDDVFAGYIDDFPEDTIKIFCMEQCYSGGFIDDLQSINNVVIATAAPYDYYSWAGDTYPYFDQFAYEWTAAVNFHDHDEYSIPEIPTGFYRTGAVDADTDSDTFCQMDEAFDWALDHKYPNDDPQYEDTSGIGGSVDLAGSGNHAPQSFNLVSPPDENTVSITPTLEWETSTDIDGDPVTYSIYYDLDDDVSDGTIAASGVSDTTYTFGASVLDYDETYYWSILATDGMASTWALSTWSFTTEEEVGVEEEPPLPISFALSSAIPNPSVNSARIEYALPRAGSIELELFDISGRKIATLANGYYQPGYYEVSVSDLSSGVYLYRLVANEFTDTKMMVVAK